MGRPYFNLSTIDIYKEGKDAFEENDVPRLKLCIYELKHYRTTNLASDCLEELSSLLAEIELPRRFRESMELDDPWPQREWLLELEKVMEEVTPETGGHHSVYLVCLWNCDEDFQHGVYVGLTGKAPEERYRQHKRGIKAGHGWVRDYGIGLLKPFYENLIEIDYEEAKELEAEVADILSEEGFIVRGGH